MPGVGGHQTETARMPELWADGIAEIWSQPDSNSGFVGTCRNCSIGGLWNQVIKAQFERDLGV